MKIIWCFIIALTATVVAIESASADCIPKQGSIDNETWMSDSTYCITGDILALNLTIEPGVRIVFTGNYIFEVHGILEAVGTVQDSIIFTRADSASGWKGIYFNYSLDGSEMAYCRIDSTTNHGIHIEESDPVIRNCLITNNRVNKSSNFNGAGILVEGHAKISNSVISYNSIYTGSGDVAIRGGGIYAHGSLELENCILSGNYLSSRGGSFQTTISYGGGIYASGELTLSNSIIIGNSCTTHSSGNYGEAYCYGGGICHSGGILKTNNCIFSNNRLSSNQSNTYGGGLYLSSSSHESEIINSTFAYNYSGIYCAGDTAEVVNSIFYYNDNDQISGNLTVTYSDIQHGFEGVGNIDENPVFYSSDELRITSVSPCIDAGNPSFFYNDRCFPPSLGTERNDMGAHGGCCGCGWNELPYICCPDSITTSTCEQGEVCVDVRIRNAETVTAVDAIWTQDLLCFNADHSGIYPFTVIASNSFGSDTHHVFVDLTIIEKPVACFTATPMVGVPPLEVSFSNCTTPTAGLSYMWYFGDGNTSTEFEPVHTFMDVTPDTVSLIAYNECWADTFRKVVPTNSIISIEPDTIYLLPSEAGLYSETALMIDSVVNVMGIHADIVFDPAKVKIVDYEIGDFLSINGAYVTDLSELDSLNGVFNVSLTAAGGSPEGVSGGGKVMRIDFMSTVEDPTSTVEIASPSVRDTANYEEAIRTENCIIQGIEDLLADLDSDLDVDFADFTLFVNCWNGGSDSLYCDIAQYHGGDNPPWPPPWSKTNYPYPADGMVDFEDQMVITIMYNWCKAQSSPFQLFERSLDYRMVNKEFNIDCFAPDEIRVGETFSVLFRVSETLEAIGMKASISFDNNMMQLISKSVEGIMPKSDGIITNLDTEQDDKIVVSRSILGGLIQNCAPISIELIFMAKAEGNTTVCLETIDFRNCRNLSLDNDGTREGIFYEISISADGHMPPTGFCLRQNYPNPFNPTTNIAFDIKEPTHVTLEIYDVSGRLIKTVRDGFMIPGKYVESWDGKDNQDQSVTSGIYFCRLVAGGFIDTRKIVMMR